MNQGKFLRGLLVMLVLAAHSYGQPKVTDGFTRTANGLYYKVVIDNHSVKGKVGDILKMNLVYTTQKDSVIFSTFDEEMGPAQFTCSPPTFNGDPMEGFALLGQGDSAIFLMPVDSAYKNQPYPPFAKKGEFVKIRVYVLSLMSQEEYERKKQEEMKMQTEKEVQTIEDYLTKKGLHAERTAEGLYYVIEKQGEGARAEAGKTVTVNYTGKLLDGKVFDSSLNPGRTPFEFKLGAGQVIKGWDEGIALFNVGGKGTLVIPSAMAYGSRSQGPIPANSILVFDIELLGVR